MVVVDGRTVAAPATIDAVVLACLEHCVRRRARRALEEQGLESARQVEALRASVAAGGGSLTAEVNAAKTGVEIAFQEFLKFLIPSLGLSVRVLGLQCGSWICGSRPQDWKSRFWRCQSPA